jgi:uncharacterized phage infection (PIP) family protein YhgE
MTRLVTVLALLTACLTAGCGGSSSSGANDYVTAVNKAQTDFAANVQKNSNGGTDTFARLDTALDKIVTDLKAADPPDKVKDLHTTLVTEFSNFKASVKEISDAVGTNDPAKIAAAQTKFAAATTAIQTKLGTTITAINTKLQE